MSIVASSLRSLSHGILSNIHIRSEPVLWVFLALFAAFARLVEGPIKDCVGRPEGQAGRKASRGLGSISLWGPRVARILISEDPVEALPSWVEFRCARVDRPLPAGVEKVPERFQGSAVVSVRGVDAGRGQDETLRHPHRPTTVVRQVTPSESLGDGGPWPRLVIGRCRPVFRLYRSGRTRARSLFREPYSQTGITPDLVVVGRAGRGRLSPLFLPNISLSGILGWIIFRSSVVYYN